MNDEIYDPIANEFVSFDEALDRAVEYEIAALEAAESGAWDIADAYRDAVAVLAEETDAAVDLVPDEEPGEEWHEAHDFGPDLALFAHDDDLRELVDYFDMDWDDLDAVTGEEFDLSYEYEET